jgi:ribosome-binding protein aMBF1 (putative translation factor)
MAKKAAKKATARTTKKAAGTRPAKGEASPMAGPTMRETIIKAIEDSGKSVRSIALGVGIDPSQLSRFVAGERDLLLEAADKLARSLGLKLMKDDSTG